MEDLPLIAIVKLEERTDVGSSTFSRYGVTNRKVSEMNYDFLGNINYDINENLN